jgi:hypothetical protein
MNALVMSFVALSTCAPLFLESIDDPSGGPEMVLLESHKKLHDCVSLVLISH